MVWHGHTPRHGTNLCRRQIGRATERETKNKQRRTLKIPCLGGPGSETGPGSRAGSSAGRDGTTRDRAAMLDARETEEVEGSDGFVLLRARIRAELFRMDDMVCYVYGEEWWW